MSFKNYRRTKPGWAAGPCPICGEKGRCSQSADGVWAVCYRTFTGAVSQKEGDLGPYGVFLLNARTQSKLSNFEGSLITSTTRRHVAEQVESAHLETLNEVYSELLQAWSLSEKHRDGLEKHRGLSPFEIKRMRYSTADASDEAIAPVVKKFGKTLLYVPGFYWKSGRIRFACKEKLLAIPTINTAGKIVNLRLRLDPPRGRIKFIYASSTGFAGPGAVMSHHFVASHRNPEHSECWITEGEIKAHVLAYKMNVNAISIPGVNVWKHAVEALNILSAKSAVIAIDADWREKHQVAKPLLALSRNLQEGGYNVQFAKWYA